MGGGWSTPRLGCFTPRKVPVPNCIGGCVGPRDSVNWCGKSRPPPGFGPRTVQPVASRYTDCAIAAHTIGCKYKKGFKFEYKNYLSQNAECLSVGGGVVCHLCLFTAPWICLNVRRDLET